MPFLELLADPRQWERYYEYKCTNTPPQLLRGLRRFIDTQGYVPVVEAILSGRSFGPPRKTILSKQSSSKKRTVYTYPSAENLVLKLLSYLMVRRFDRLLPDNLYSFRCSRSVQDAIARITSVQGVEKLYAYKVDISDYFNSVDIDLLEPILAQALADEPELKDWIMGLLRNPLVLENGQPVEERKGIMAGTPISVFLANLYLAELDRSFLEQGRIYARYSDDILVLAESEEALAQYRQDILTHLERMHLTVNPKKESTTAPHECWDFLGISFRDGEIDVSAVSVAKIKAKIRRKARSLQRWQRRKGLPGTRAAAALIRTFNRKLLENDKLHELTWVRWFFPLINTTRSLGEIDRYLQDNIRFLAAGTRGKGRFRFRYEDMKALGYVSLVNRYYKALNDKE